MTDTEAPTTDDRWQPTRRKRGRARDLTPEQLALADDLHTRALAIRAACEEGMSIREAVQLAAIQLGVEPPQAAHDAGPSVREAADADRRWPLEKAGQ